MYDGAVWNSTGREPSEDMREFFICKARGIEFGVPLYYCELGIVEAECGIMVIPLVLPFCLVFGSIKIYTFSIT